MLCNERERERERETTVVVHRSDVSQYGCGKLSQTLNAPKASYLSPSTFKYLAAMQEVFDIC